MARFRSSKRAKELQRKAKHDAKEARKKERQEKPAGGAQFPALPQSPRLRRKYQLHSDLPDPGQI